MLADDNFHRSVVFVLAHDADGSLGVVLNRPSRTPVEEIVPAWRALAAAPPVVFSGGPVQPNAAICIGQTELPDVASTAGFAPLVGLLGTVDLHEDPVDLPIPIAQVRVFAGYAGWAAGQLQSEIDDGAWLTLSGRHEDVLSIDPEGLWSQVLRRQGGWLAAVARFPADPSDN